MASNIHPASLNLFEHYISRIIAAILLETSGNLLLL